MDVQAEIPIIHCTVLFWIYTMSDKIAQDCGAWLFCRVAAEVLLKHSSVVKKPCMTGVLRHRWTI